MAVAEISKTIVRPLEKEVHEEKIHAVLRQTQEAGDLELRPVPIHDEMRTHLAILQRQRTAQRQFSRCRAQMEETELPETTLIRERFQHWFEEKRKQAADLAFQVGQKRKWENEQYDTWEERWENAFALAQTGRIMEEDLEEIEAVQELADYDQEERDENEELPRCPFIEDLAEECMDI